MAEVDRELGRLSARMEAVEKDISAMSAKLDRVHDTIIGASGSWRALLYVAGAAAFLGGLIVSVLAWLWPAR